MANTAGAWEASMMESIAYHSQSLEMENRTPMSRREREKRVLLACTAETLETLTRVIKKC